MNRAACVAYSLMAMSLSVSSVGAQIDLTGEWALTGTDEAGTIWNAEMYIGQGPLVDGKHPLTGSIHWHAAGGKFEKPASAWEDFRDGVYQTQCYFDPLTMSLQIQGYQVRDVSSDGLIHRATSRATISQDGMTMIDGTGSGSAVVPGSWTAQRQGVVVALSASDGTASGSAVIFPVRLSAASSQPVTVEYETFNDTAVKGEDYVYTYNTLTIPVGGTTASITVPLLDTATPGTSLILSLYNIENAILVTEEVVGTIPDDWVAPPPADSGGSGGTGMCGQGVGVGNLIAFGAMCWLGLVAARCRRLP